MTPAVGAGARGASRPVPGDRAPDFDLESHLGEEVRLPVLLVDGPVLLVFYPFAFSPVCGNEIAALVRDHGRFAEAGVRVVGISTDTKYSLAAWARELEVPFPLLSDFWPHGAVASAYGVFDAARGMAGRGAFLVNREGIVVDAVVAGPAQARDFRRFLPPDGTATETFSARPSSERP
ncbi:redoxin domain-containing protein [Brevibacterium samyangense]|uniref:thioredoxin-dependent peroxiredoxin n=1 Tax=Brevibacterium samyangense TaxID=366888 RepID=A0ABP5EVM8_9MICO